MKRILDKISSSVMCPLLLLLTILTIILLVCYICTKSQNKDDITDLQTISNNEISIWTDPETNVQYIVYEHIARGYCRSGITVRVTKDGTPYIASDDTNDASQATE